MPTPAQLRILFVDDEIRILNARARALKRLCPDWLMFHADSSQRALKLLERVAVEVVVTDITMDGMIGTGLLRVVKQRHPQIVRMVFSGMLDTESLVESAKWSERNLCKPCTPEKLRDQIELAVQTRRVSESARMPVAGRMERSGSMIG